MLRKELNQKRNQLHVGFLFSSPYSFDQEGVDQISDQLSYRKESRLIKEMAQGKNITFRKSMATVEKLTDMLLQEPKVLHISCHGLTLTNNGVAQNYLLFENEAGHGELVSE